MEDSPSPDYGAALLRRLGAIPRAFESRILRAGRVRLVAYGTVLERRLGETPRAFESRTLRSLEGPSDSWRRMPSRKRSGFMTRGSSTLPPSAQ